MTDANGYGVPRAIACRECGGVTATGLFDDDPCPRCFNAGTDPDANAYDVEQWRRAGGRATVPDASTDAEQEAHMRRIVADLGGEWTPTVANAAARLAATGATVRVERSRDEPPPVDVAYGDAVARAGMHQPAGGTPRARCRSCGAEVVWVVTERGKKMPIDAEPVAGGNVVRVRGTAEGVRYVKPSEVVAPNVPRYVSHFSTCAHAAQHRRRD